MNAQNLLDKYIKYDSKITFDIFKSMYQKLIDLEFTTPHEVENAFKEFSGKYQYFVMKVYDHKSYFNQYNDILSPQSEISVEDLLGYNPFESFELPEKWCIKVTKENQKILSKWRTDGSCSVGIYLLSPYHPMTSASKAKIGYGVTNIPEDTLEITFTQFKQYVLKEPVVTKPPKPFPTRWCIELNKTTIPIVGNYYNKKHLTDPNCVTYTECAEGHYVRSHNNAGEYVKNGYNFCSFFNSPSDEYPEITLEDFKQFVMEETTNKTEKDWSKATKEELLEEARRKYPMGTEYNPLGSNGEIGCYIKDVRKVSYSPRYVNGGIECGIGYIYAKGNWAKIISLPETKVEEVVPEYVECSYSASSTFILNKIYKCHPGSTSTTLKLDSEKGDRMNLPYEGSVWKFKPSTKEAFEMQTKPLEKWSVGSYIVPLQNKLLTRDEPLIKGKPYQITKRSSVPYIMCEKGMEINFCDDYDPETREGIKWFATLTEAEEFAKTLVKSVECEEGKCTSEITKTRFKKGDYVVSLRPEHLSTLAIKFNHCYIQYKDGDKISISSGTTMYEDDIKYARLATPEEIEEYKRIGKPYDVTTLHPSINTYGLNVGDKLDAITIVAWEKQGFNYFSDSSEGWRFGNGAPYFGDRKIKNFKVIDGVVGFLVSGTLGSYLRAEGFKEFAEKFTKSEFSSDKIEETPKFEVGKWYRITDGKSKCIGKDIWYAKSIVVRDNIVIAGEYWHNYLDTNGNFGNVGDYTFTEVPLSEIQQFLPDGHPDKIEEAPKKVIEPETFRVRVTSSYIKILKI